MPQRPDQKPPLTRPAGREQRASRWKSPQTRRAGGTWRGKPCPLSPPSTRSPQPAAPSGTPGGLDPGGGSWLFRPVLGLILALLGRVGSLGCIMCCPLHCSCCIPRPVLEPSIPFHSIVFLCVFVQQAFIENLLCAGQCSRCWSYNLAESEFRAPGNSQEPGNKRTPGSGASHGEDAWPRTIEQSCTGRAGQLSALGWSGVEWPHCEDDICAETESRSFSLWGRK